jgi:hypothetical protein
MSGMFHALPNYTKACHATIAPKSWKRSIKKKLETKKLHITRSKITLSFEVKYYSISNAR